MQCGREHAKNVRQSGERSKNLDVAINSEVLKACQLAPQHVKLGTDPHHGANAIHAPTTAQGLPIHQSVPA